MSDPTLDAVLERLGRAVFRPPVDSVIEAIAAGIDPFAKSPDEWIALGRAAMAVPLDEGEPAPAPADCTITEAGNRKWLGKATVVQVVSNDGGPLGYDTALKALKATYPMMRWYEIVPPESRGTAVRYFALRYEGGGGGDGIGEPEPKGK